MKRLIISMITMMLLGCSMSCAQTYYPWRQQISSNCQGLNSNVSCGGQSCTLQDLCWDTTLKIMFTCSSVSSNVCTWVAGGGGWVDNGTFLYPFNVTHPVAVGSGTPEAGVILDIFGNMHIGSNLIRCDATNGCRIDSTNNGSTDVTIKNSTITLSGGYAYTGTNPYINVTRTTDKSTPAVGDFWYNSTYPGFVYYTGASLKRIPTELTYSITATPVASSNTLLWKAPYNSRIDTINCIVDPGGSSSAVINIQNCNANGSSCASVDTSSITCGNTNSADDGSLSSPTITSGDWVNLNIGTVTGSPAKLTVTVKYEYQP